MGPGGMVEAILRRRGQLQEKRALLVALSGIDGSGKTTLAREIVAELNARGVNAVHINLDAWHHAPEIRFSYVNPGEHFYQHAFRFQELFDLLLTPLRWNRAVNLTVALTRLPENDFHPHTYHYRDVEVIVLEGIFLLKRELRRQYDLAFWVDCTFETALDRAIARNQEGLREKDIIRDYQTIYFPAQMEHFAKDDPRSSADGVVVNDERTVQLASEWEYVA